MVYCGKFHMSNFLKRSKQVFCILNKTNSVHGVFYSDLKAVPLKLLDISQNLILQHISVNFKIRTKAIERPKIVVCGNIKVFFPTMLESTCVFNPIDQCVYDHRVPIILKSQISVMIPGLSDKRS